MSTIEIIIDENQDSKPFASEQMFFEKELKQAKDLISNLIEKTESIKQREQNQNRETDNQEEFHYHNTVAILGPRGVGKTSFLLSLKENIQSNKIIWLPSIDPTRMEKNEIFLVFIVANILKRIRKNNRNNLNQTTKDRLDNLCRDFSVLAPGEVQEEQWKDLFGDPHTFAYELLNQAHSGLSLAESFHEFLKECKEEMKATAFVQPIDDVDSAIEQGWPILETLRRYLATPYLITILSGDIRLYQSLVRKQQVDKLKSLIEVRKSIENEPKIMLQTGELIDQISQITDQYLAKIIPAHLRIHLVPLSTKIINEAEKGEELIKLKYGSSENSTENFENFSEIYANLYFELFNINSGKNFIDALKRRSWLPLPLLPSTNRSMVKFLKVIEPWSKNKKEKAIDKESAIESLIQVFNNSLYNGGIQTKDLLDIKSGRHLEWLSVYCLDVEQQFPGFWTLESRYDEEELNHRVLLLQAFLFQAWKSRKGKFLLYPNGPMSYIIKVCFPSWIAETLQLGKDPSKVTDLKFSLNLSVQKRHTYLIIDGLNYIMDLIQKHRQQEQNLGQYSVYSSIYSLYAEQRPYAGVAEIDVPENELLQNIDKELMREIYFILRLFMFEPTIGKKSSISIFVGLARITDALSENPSNFSELKNLFVLLTEHGSSQFYANAIGGSAESTSEHEPSDQSLEISNQSLLIKSIYNWTMVIRDKKFLDDEDLVPPLVISRAFLRFTRNLGIIRKSSTKLTFGKTLELWIAALLNSLLIEEVIFKEGIFQVNLKLEHLEESHNVEYFQENLDNYLNKGKKDKIKFTLAMLCCPLLFIFLKNTLNLDLDCLPGYQKISGSNRTDYETYLKNIGQALSTIPLKN